MIHILVSLLAKVQHLLLFVSFLFYFHSFFFYFSTRYVLFAFSRSLEFITWSVSVSVEISFFSSSLLGCLVTAVFSLGFVILVICSIPSFIFSCVAVPLRTHAFRLVLSSGNTSHSGCKSMQRTAAPECGAFSFVCGTLEKTGKHVSVGQR